MMLRCLATLVGIVAAAVPARAGGFGIPEIGVRRTAMATAFATIALELLLTRIYSVTMYYHFAFMVVSIAMLGLSVSGTGAHERGLGLMNQGLAKGGPSVWPEVLETKGTLGGDDDVEGDTKLRCRGPAEAPFGRHGDPTERGGRERTLCAEDDDLDGPRHGLEAAQPDESQREFLTAGAGLRFRHQSL